MFRGGKNFVFLMTIPEEVHTWSMCKVMHFHKQDKRIPVISTSISILCVCVCVRGSRILVNNMRGWICKKLTDD
jgi:hypothetical protein